MDAYPVRTPARARVRRLFKGALAATAALALSFAGVAITPNVEQAHAAPGAETAMAGPAAAPGTTTINTVGSTPGTVPAGVCTVTATVVGGAGGSAGVAAVQNGNGAGASITSTWNVVPGLAYTASVGGGGQQPTGNDNASTSGAGGANGGAAGGISGATSGIKHHGAGGGGYSELILGTTSAVVAGGGGGGGGGHSTTSAGAGGDAGRPTAAGVVTVGSNGSNGTDVVGSTTVQGGRGGQAAAAGAGGTNSASSSTNGVAGSGRNGGAGGVDPNPDAGGGGGGGYTGGGGGASTNGYNTQSGVQDVAGAGAGGGSSYISPSVPLGSGTSTPSAISSVAGAKIASGAGNGANGSITLVWNACTYDLAVTKSVTPTSVPRNSTVTWTVAVTNNGASAMTLGDTVTLADTLPGSGAKTIASIAVSGGTPSTILANGTFTCSAAVGATMPASLDCYRPYAIGAAAPVAGQYRGLNVGETLTVTYTQPVTEVGGTVLTNTVTVTDRTTGDSNDTATASTTVIVPPVAVDDVRSGLALGTAPNVTVLTNDTGTIAAGSVVLWNPTTSSVRTSPYVVAGEGTWTVASDVVTFTPLASFKGDPTPVNYRITSTNGLTATALVTITYVPTATNDSSLGNALYTTVNQNVLTNDDGTWNTGTLTLMNAGNPVSSIVVPSQGTWSVQTGGVIRFVPLGTFKGDPAPVTYRITDTTGDNVTATVTVGYVPSATNNSSLGNALGTTVNQNVLTNDDGDWNTATLTLMNAGNPVSSIVVPSQGTWSVQTGGVIRFVPLSTFKGDPAPVTYRITDTTGDQVTATVTVGYVPSATNDSSLGNTLGSTVTVPVLNNDDGTWNTGTLTLTVAGNPVSTIVVPGQGTWSVSSGNVIFTPLPSFLTDPAPVSYRITDTTGDNASATVTVTYLPQAVNDHLGALAIGATATVPVLANDHGDWDNATLRLVNPTTHALATSVVIAGQGTWTVSGTNVVFTPLPGFLLDPSPIDYSITDTTGDTVTATVTLDYGPSAVNDSSLGNALGTVVNLSVLTNDTGDFDSATLGFGPGNVGVGASLVVAGEGTWSVQSGGVIRFTPLPAFKGDPTPVTYHVNDTLGDSTSALMTITYVPSASNDSDLNNAWGTDVNVNVLANDDGTWSAGSVRIMDGSTPRMSLLVPGQGTWIVLPDDTVTFEPLPTFLTDPTDVTYRVTDTTGDQVTAQIHITYLPQAVDDAQGGLAIGSVATVPVLTNDNGDWSTSSLRLINPTTLAAVTSVTVSGEGTWTISGTNVVFTPLPTFLVDPTPITYRITDTTGDDATAQVVLDYGPGAADDSDLGNAIGDVVDVSVFDNDSGSFDAATLGFGPGNVGVGASLVVPGEGTWTVRSGGVIRFTPLPTFLTDPVPVHYYADDVTGDPADAWITITYLPEAEDDEDLGNAFGTVVTVDVLANDTGDFPAGEVRLRDGAGLPVSSLHVPGQGTWDVLLDDTISFTPDSGFLVDPDPVDYEVTDSTGDVVTATITVTYLPLAVDDARGNLTIGAAVTIPVLSNDNGSFTASSVRLIDPVTLAVAPGSVVVAGQGTWSLGASGTIVFTPAPGFLVDPDPIDYQVTDVTGDTAGATITLDYVPAAANDSDLGNTIGDTVDLSVWANDTGDFDITTLGFGAGTGVGTTLVVAGEGTWSVRAGGVIRFVPLPTFQLDPTPVTYYVSDVTGDGVSALITVTYVPVAADDSDLGNTLGDDVNVDVLANDTGDFEAGTVSLMNGVLPVPSLTVAGQGTWTVLGDDTITFSPLASFLTDPTPVNYRVRDLSGDYVAATITITYLPQAVNDAQGGLAIGAVATVAVLGNDHGVWNNGSLRLINPTTLAAVTSVTVSGQGVWTISGTNVVFTPQSGFLVDPTPLTYRITDTTGDQVTAVITLDYVPAAADDSDLGNTIGDVVDLSVLANDTGSFDSATLGFGPGNVGVGAALVVPGEGTWTVRSGGVIRFTPVIAFAGDPTPVTYYVDDVTGDAASALMTITYIPAAANDSDLGNTIGDDVNVDVLGNDTGAFTAGTVRIQSGASWVSTLTVGGQGTWTVLPDDTITFAPASGFLTDPSVITYRVRDTTGDYASATVTITYLPVAADDSDLDNTIGTTVNVVVLTNDTGSFTANSVRILDVGGPVSILIVAGEGEWRANNDGSVTFIPEVTFLTDPTPVRYQVTDVTGDVVDALVTITYLPSAVADRRDGNSIGTSPTVDPLVNDLGDFDVTSVRLIDPVGGGSVASVVVAGQGTWTVNTTTGVVTFAPASGYVGNPTAMGYRVTDTTGDTVQSTITVTYLPAASNDQSLGNKQGTKVDVSILGNDTGALDVSTARLLNPAGTPMMNVIVPGEGTWHMNATTGVVSFTPEPGFTGDPTPIDYRVLDVNGNPAVAQVLITYLAAPALALTGVSFETPLMIALAAIILGLGALIVSRTRRITARHRA